MHSALDEISKINYKKNTEAHMDKIKHTLNGLGNKINEMRRKFKKYSIKENRSEISGSITTTNTPSVSTISKNKPPVQKLPPRQLSQLRSYDSETTDDLTTNNDDDYDNSTIEDTTTFDNSSKKESISKSKNPALIDITVKIELSDNKFKQQNIRLNRKSRIIELKKMIYEKEKAINRNYQSIDDYIFTFNGNDLEDENLTFDDYGIRDGGVIFYELY